MDITLMTDQQIIDYVRANASSPKTVGAVKSAHIEAFFKKHNIPVRCPHCKSTKKLKMEPMAVVLHDINAKIAVETIRLCLIQSLRVCPIQ